MPNWCNNHLTLSGTKSQIKAIEDAMEKMRSENSENSLFNYLKPQPSDLGDDWYDWRVANWGTKWDLPHEDFDDFKFSYTEEEGFIEARFATAWGPPVEAFQYFSKNTEGIMCTLCYCEPGNDFCGIYDTESGDREYSLRDDDKDPLLDELFGIEEMLACDDDEEGGEEVEEEEEGESES